MALLAAKKITASKKRLTATNKLSVKKLLRKGALGLGGFGAGPLMDYKLIKNQFKKSK